jgi:hypothetical protein
MKYGFHGNSGLPESHETAVIISLVDTAWNWD